METTNTLPSFASLETYIAELTQQEHKVLKLTLQDCTCKEIAEQLGVSTSTIIKHRKNIIKKLKLRGKIAFRKALRVIEKNTVI